MSAGLTAMRINNGGRNNKDFALFINDVNSLNQNQNKNNTEAGVVIMGVSLDHLSETSQLLVCCTGVFVFYLIYGYVQEIIFSLEGFQPFGWYLTLVQFGCYGIFGMVEINLQRDFTRRIPLQTYAFLAFLTVSTMGLSNTSLGYLNYPTQVIFKSCKLIPVMIGGVFIQGKKYDVLDVIACLSMSLGLILFTLADSEVSPKFDETGILLISLALCADAVIGNVQERAMKAHSSSNTEMILYSYGIGFFYILFGLILTGRLKEPFEFCAKHPVHTYGYAMVFSLTGYLGIAFVLSLVKHYGALLAVTVTTFRKALTIIFSFLLFTKPFTFQYVWSGFIVLFGICLNIYSKNREKMKKSLQQYWERKQSKKYAISQEI